MAQNELGEAQQTYSGFIGVAKWATIALALIVAFVIWLIS